MPEIEINDDKVHRFAFMTSVVAWALFEWFLSIRYVGIQEFSILVFLSPCIISYGFWKFRENDSSWGLVLPFIAFIGLVRGLIDLEGNLLELIRHSLQLLSLGAGISLIVFNLTETTRQINTYGLKSLPMVQLRESIDTAFDLYGIASEVEDVEGIPEAKRYVFEPRGLFEVVIIEWNEQIHCAVYSPACSFPVEDLRLMKSHFGGERKWREIEKGYWYITEDEDIRLWCSVMPPIGVDTKEYRERRWAKDESITSE